MAVSDEFLLRVAGVTAKGITDIYDPAVNVGYGEDNMFSKELVEFRL